MEGTPGVKQRADFTIRDIKNELKAILIEDKRKGLESQESMWRDAVEQLAGYMRLVRADQGATILCGAVVIGT
jgi:hypothetical protein